MNRHYILRHKTGKFVDEQNDLTDWPNMAQQFTGYRAAQEHARQFGLLDCTPEAID